ncbi:hypothetical protein Glove_103g213 [Diversispora epigaea]|uniref:Uncharacterized protein n=1 Tax=Diversispora epigaea TaxID=1348612 RepID=A0A397JDS3_9GLOM|nr:hypothetical protein Glove_103g213 [Diversispora epigaea]
MSLTTRNADDGWVEIMNHVADGLRNSGSRTQKLTEDNVKKECKWTGRIGQMVKLNNGSDAMTNLKIIRLSYRSIKSKCSLAEYHREILDTKDRIVPSTKNVFMDNGKQ